MKPEQVTGNFHWPIRKEYVPLARTHTHANKQMRPYSWSHMEPYGTRPQHDMTVCQERPI